MPSRDNCSGQPLRRFPAAAIDDAALPGPGPHKGEHLLVGLLLRQNAVSQVFTVEAADKDSGLLQPQMLHDIPPHAIRGRGRKRHDRGARKALAQEADLPVLRAEIVAPLGNAMRFVHGDAAHVPGCRALQKTGQHQALRGGIEQLDFAVVKGAQPRLGLRAIERGIQKSGRNACGAQRIHLVFHERNQRRDDDREPLLHGGRELKAE